MTNTVDLDHYNASFFLTSGPDGSLVGKDPSTVEKVAYSALNVTSSLKKAVRAKCMDCCNNVFSEVRNCTAYKCPLWAFRMGKNPLHGRAKGQNNGDDNDDD